MAAVMNRVFRRNSSASPPEMNTGSSIIPQGMVSAPIQRIPAPVEPQLTQTTSPGVASLLQRHLSIDEAMLGQQYPPAQTPAAEVAQRRRASEPASTDELPLSLKDAIFLNQLGEKNFLSFGPGILVAAKVCAWTRDASKVHKGLVKAGVLGGEMSGSSNGEGTSTYLPVTSRITSALPKQVKILARPALKRLIRLLFFWEEEVMRYRVAEQEQAELKTIAERLSLKMVQIKNQIRQLPRVDPAGHPSQRDSTQAEELQEESDKTAQLLNELDVRAAAIRMTMQLLPSARSVDVQLPGYS
jgi:hypothetical protein